ncbi:MAG: BREX-1 system phosphatase PglZ type A [Deltaproteobacteria bacterium]|nr:BREX-1 system phosphatase PglZ type A [Deltaproteobacteria bacterium]
MESKMIHNITQALERRFEKHRIVFWYDDKEECCDLFESLSLPDVTKKIIANNEFGLKYTILKEYPQKKFLLYKKGPRPSDLDDWLLDILLANEEFKTDQASFWLDELGLDDSYADLVRDHACFFDDFKRVNELKSQMVGTEESYQDLQIKMMAVCVQTDDVLVDSVVQALLNELAQNKSEFIDLVTQCSLDKILYQVLKQRYAYQSTSPGVKDFAIMLFGSCFSMSVGMTGKLNQDAMALFRQWKNNVKSQDAFVTLSGEYEKILGVETQMRNIDYKDIVHVDYFEVVDGKILKALVDGSIKQTMMPTECQEIVRRRLGGFRFKEHYVYLYKAIDVASQFMSILEATDLHMSDMADGVSRYAKTWYRVDQLYRQFIYNINKSGQITIVQDLVNKVENLYSNKYLLTLNDRWQEVLDKTPKWTGGGATSQAKFFDHVIKGSYFAKNKKVYVIISDALRYEIGDELAMRIRQEDKFEAETGPMLTLLPSTTAIGMAALLPNVQIEIIGETGDVLVDGMSTQGSNNRLKVLQVKLGESARVVLASDFVNFTKEESRNLVRDFNAVYIYHNHIDATGDKRDSEHRVFDAVEDSITEIIKIIKKLTNANATNVVVTADHGFIYQNQTTDESDFAEAEARGVQIYKTDRRYILGKGLDEQKGLKKYLAGYFGLKGDLEIQVPKSINRLRQKGSGSRYVHGGSSLQEIVVPVVKINKTRQEDVELVDVEIIRGSTSLITSGQLAVVFYQTRSVIEKTQPRELRAGIYSSTGVLVSDQHHLVFNSASELGRERETQVQFIMTKEANNFNNQEVILKLEKQEKETSHYTKYKSVCYTIRRSITSDFDF